MPFDVHRLPIFNAHLEKVLKKYSLSQSRINNLINSLADFYQKGIVYPGFGECQVRKIRFGLEEYGLNERKGLRLLYIVIPQKNKIVPLMAYKKGDFKSEKEVNGRAKKHLKEFLSALSPK